jgi:AraC family transcriptional regulator
MDNSSAAPITASSVKKRAQSTGKLVPIEWTAMKDSVTRKRAERIGRVIDYLSAHLDEDIDVERLSSVAHLSKFHFHRVFKAHTCIPVAQLVSLMRLKRASFQLAFNRSYSITDIALGAGFANPESFSRAFKKAQGQTPSQFRAHPEWDGWTQKYQVHDMSSNQKIDVTIVNFAEEKVAVLEHAGPASALMNSVMTFIEWRKESGLSPAATSNTYGVPYADPETVPHEEFRFDICGSIRSDVPPNAQGVITKVIPGGRCAKTRHKGSTDAIAGSVRWLYANWLPGSNQELRDFPCFFHYIKRMPEVSEHEQITDIYLPLR